ncbi:hypothetical protein BDM02DRAFT_3126916 [Thelephora ganbajun]|uniref:Uncharacterized protein n=1 Tax=Thelephora ganbajun TaxID=370292 RepID=A0ACB6ZQE4_THEGA|nr:hypothetical protein BDM02DRAFT_3126916 [Thelephora ganbajun]
MDTCIAGSGVHTELHSRPTQEIKHWQEKQTDLGVPQIPPTRRSDGEVLEQRGDVLDLQHHVKPTQANERDKRKALVVTRPQPTSSMVEQQLFQTWIRSQNKKRPSGGGVSRKMWVTETAAQRAIEKETKRDEGRGILGENMPGDFNLSVQREFPNLGIKVVGPERNGTEQSNGISHVGPVSARHFVRKRHPPAGAHSVVTRLAGLCGGQSDGACKYYPVDYTWFPRLTAFHRVESGARDAWKLLSKDPALSHQSASAAGENASNMHALPKS